MTITLSPEAAAVLASDGQVWVSVEGDWNPAPDIGDDALGPPAELVAVK